MKRLEGVAKHYHWGSPEAIPALLGRSPDGHPYAEWWLGTHHAGEATLADGRQLGDVAGSLPYLLKLLSAAEPLSLQTHPSTAQARAGFDAEELAGAMTEQLAALFEEASPRSRRTELRRAG